MRAAFDAAWLLSVPGLSRWDLCRAPRRLVEVVADRQGDIGVAEVTRASPRMGATATRVPTMSSVIAPAARAAPTAQW